MSAIVGIDPGQKGALAFLKDGVLVEYTAMPKTVKGIFEWFVDIRYADGLIIVTERAQTMPKQGAVSAFNYGRHFGGFEVLAMAMQLPYHEVGAAQWKKVMGLSKEKATSIKLCEQLFPEVELILPGCRTKHDGIAEACLIAEYARRSTLCQ